MGQFGKGKCNFIGKRDSVLHTYLLLADLGLRQAAEAACGYLLSFGTQVAIVEPPALREKIIELAESIVALV